MWQKEGITATILSTHSYRINEEMENLNPARIMSRVMSGMPVGPGEEATEVQWEKIPRSRWTIPPRPDQVVELLLNLANDQPGKIHVESPEVIAKHALWTRQWKRHCRRVRLLKKEKDDLDKRGELSYRVALRVQKRTSEMREEAATLKEWLAEGHLQPTYAFRFTDIQRELKEFTCERLLKEVKQGLEEQNASGDGESNSKKVKT
jgi:hypothetical protein